MPPQHLSRRSAIGLGSLGLVASLGLKPAFAASEFGMKGQYWESGVIYKKPSMDELLEMENDQLLCVLSRAKQGLAQLGKLYSDGQFEELGAGLRGGVFSEGEVRKAVRLLMDRQEDENIQSRALEAFGHFTESFDALDDAVVVESRRKNGYAPTLGLAVISPFSAAKEISQINSPSPQWFGRNGQLGIPGALYDATVTLGELTQILGGDSAALCSKSSTVSQ
eukprot:CAMPEP_0172605106 /NCGR_PEP_ID=MMETSP1068-20121228/25346_1 /TAXON_ID=35684 /ORGANISM="Pseudopedinella elastica, Strain CCMP716" /LENGTH=222 /DNA_ID=CAMNT_0013407393 /DNA_START=25 /DNA_END=693 /DNA_ORIENTATION=+